MASRYTSTTSTNTLFAFCPTLSPPFLGSRKRRGIRISRVPSPTTRPWNPTRSSRRNVRFVELFMLNWLRRTHDPQGLTLKLFQIQPFKIRGQVCILIVSRSCGLQRCCYSRNINIRNSCSRIQCTRKLEHKKYFVICRTAPKLVLKF